MMTKMNKDLDIKNLHQLGGPAKLLLAIIVIVGILILGYGLLFRSQLDALETAATKETELKSTYNEKSIQTASLDNLKKELASLRSAFDVLLRQLPTDAEIPNLIQELHQAGASNGMRMDSVSPKAPINDGPIQILPYDISISGRYNQISQFTRDVGQLSRIITLESLQLKSDDKSNQLTLSATANTYKARPAEEVAAELEAAASEANKN
ncbi:pilus assembly protein PilO [Neisseria arctica]|uniref:Pilus assembly protein PilO n=1 Tax=Neisseria arctica TaxID=1470200 RepID=A0A0J0YST9_9NEIS|nr:type 4a pilus biogenesis protein PilO [Neisseria arctica]KLT73174.1 pilus assembly protein PilO [Neisseria arctica]UOO87690.1 type 4a pilus biogenesis protein PilO [Neisseria arctica]